MAVLQLREVNFCHERANLVMEWTNATLQIKYTKTCALAFIKAELVKCTLSIMCYSIGR